jgi:3-methyl-2-oxobutanoate hydroxymethyltransferase
MKKTLQYLKNKKENNKKITVLTSYDYPTTLMLEKAEIDMIILGDSVGTNILGYNDETQVTMDDMIHHTKAVCRAKKDIYLVVDLPYKTHETTRDAVKNARKLIELGADAVKFEGIKADVLKSLKENKIDVMCHIGLNPQYDQERMKGGIVSQGKVFQEAINLLEGAKTLEKNGMDLIILEKIPERISKIITQNINVPTIGIGAGKYCDGQVLIINDLLGINERTFKHVPKYINLQEIIINIVKKYQNEIDLEIFPGKENINIIKNEEYQKVEDWCIKTGFKI